MLKNSLQLKSWSAELICFVGAGGKTSSMFSLAHELVNHGARVLVTTTTKIYLPESQTCDQLVIDLEPPPAMPGLSVWGQAVTDEGKLVGPSIEAIDRLYAAGVFDYILVEADGAHGFSIKAPADYEPVIPTFTTKVVGVIGLSCLGQKANRQTVHRLPLWCQLTGTQPDDDIQELHLVSLITSPDGLFKNVPRVSSRYLLLNQADTIGRRQAAVQIIKQLLLDEYPFQAGIIADIQARLTETFYQRQFISGVILASGQSRRFNGNKLLADYQGYPLVEWVIKAACCSELDEVIVVFHDTEVKEIALNYPVKPVFNPNPEYGQSQAIKCGLSHTNTDAAVMFLTGDQPLITSDLINLLISHFRTENQLVVQPAYRDNPGNPVLFSRDLRTDLARLTGDFGGRVIINQLTSHQVATIAVENPDLGFDIDTVMDYQRLLKDLS